MAGLINWLASLEKISHGEAGCGLSEAKSRNCGDSNPTPEMMAYFS